MAIYNKPLSPSSISMYVDCPYKFYLRYIYGLKIPSGEAAQFGSSIHKINEMFWGEYKLQSNSAIAMQDTINKYWDKGIGEEYESASHECVSNFLAIINETPQLIPLYTEFKAENSINHTISIVDAVYPHKIVDYKTSKQYTVTPKEANIIQAVMCSENLKQCTGLEVRRVEFQYLRYKKYQYVDVTPELISQNDALIEDVKNKIIQDIFPKTKKTCFFCDYALICKAEKQTMDTYIKKQGVRKCTKQMTL